MLSYKLPVNACGVHPIDGALEPLASQVEDAQAVKPVRPGFATVETRRSQYCDRR